MKQRSALRKRTKQQNSDKLYFIRLLFCIFSQRLTLLYKLEKPLRMTPLL